MNEDDGIAIHRLVAHSRRDQSLDVHLLSKPLSTLSILNPTPAHVEDLALVGSQRGWLCPFIFHLGNPFDITRIN